MSAIDHDYIYLQPPCCADEDVGRLWCEDPDPTDCEDGKHWTKYVRADIHERLHKSLASEKWHREIAEGALASMQARVEELEKDAARYRLIRRNVCITGGPPRFHVLNIVPTYVAPSAAIELDTALDAMAKEQGDAKSDR